VGGAALDGPPLVAITTYRQLADWGTWRSVDADLLPSAYARSVEQAGGVAVLVPPVGSSAAAEAVIAGVGALILSGGADVNPARYGQEPDAHVTRWYDDRDQSELWLLEAAQRRGLPVLGICRGMQVMAVAAGGSLIQHLPDRVGHDRHTGGDGYAAIDVAVEPGHRVSQLVDENAVVPCHHHQAVDRHPGYVGTAWCGDGVLQAMEAEGDRFEVAVQWHPETADDKRLFAALVEQARIVRSRN
jgi:putative glutamine amidotransferase